MSWANVNITNTSYGNTPGAPTLFGQYMNWLATEDFHYSCQWTGDYAKGSKIDCTELKLAQEFVHYYSYDKQYHRIYQGEEEAVYVYEYTDYGYRKVQIRVLAKSSETRERRYKKIKLGLIEHDRTPNLSKISVGFWRNSMNGGDRFSRDIDYKPWANISLNYSEGTRDVLDQLFKVTPESIDGKIILLHGPAGSGKTTLLCSLAHAWRSWVDMEYIIDPEVFLNSASYITEAFLGKTAENDRYRLLVLEDSGELIAANAKNQTGQALSRLLNLSDGMLGAGRKLLIAITTNDDIKALHPAVTRPGRCLIQAEIGRLSVRESQSWLGPGHQVSEPMTLAELYHIRNAGEKNALGTKRPEVTVGQYL